MADNIPNSGPALFPRRAGAQRRAVETEMLICVRSLATVPFCFNAAREHRLTPPAERPTEVHPVTSPVEQIVVLRGLNTSNFIA